MEKPGFCSAFFPLKTILLLEGAFLEDQISALPLVGHDRGDLRVGGAISPREQHRCELRFGSRLLQPRLDSRFIANHSRLVSRDRLGLGYDHDTHHMDATASDAG